MADSKKYRSRIEREKLRERIEHLLCEMFDPKMISFLCKISDSYVYQFIRDLGYTRHFLSAEEVEIIRRRRVEEVHLKQKTKSIEVVP
jgi:hypothetical protein